MRERTLGLNVALRGERLHGLDDLKVLNVGDLGVSRGVEVLGGNENTLCLSRREGAACGQRGWSTRVKKKRTKYAPLKRCSKMAFRFCLEMSIFKRLEENSVAQRRLY